MHIIKKIISGGQTGVDQAALRVALDSGIEIGGWCPPGRNCENGKIPSEYTLKETENDRSPSAPNIPRSQRTEYNVRDSEGTLVIKPLGLKNNKGTEWTIKCCQNYEKPYLVIDPYKKDSMPLISDWIKRNQIRILNVAGPSEKAFSGINHQTQTLLHQLLFDKVNEKNNTQNNKASVPSEPLPWWIAFPINFVKGSEDDSSSISKFVIKTLIIFSAIFILIFILNQILGFRIEEGKVYFGSPQQYLGTHVTVDSTAGFQNSGISVKAGDRLILKPEGRVHIAMDHANNLARTVKGIIISESQDKSFSDEQKKRYPKPNLDPSFVFYRDWNGPEGDPTKSDLLEECKLRRDFNWGALIAIIMPNDNISAKADPYEVLNSNGLNTSDLILINSEKEIVITKDGYLFFIINEAIISPYSPSSDSKRFYETLKKSQDSLVNDPIHQIPLSSIPLIWYADNNGAFRIIITRIK